MFEQLCDVTIPEMAHLWINWQHFAKPIFNHPLIGNLKRCKQQPPVVEFMHGLYRKSTLHPTSGSL